MPKVSVIMAVYNLENVEILGKSIASIQNQTCSDIEFIICDDGSTDNTRELLKKFAKKDRRIKLIYNSKNRKASYARNKCIKHAKGNYIAVMDADDISDIRRIERLSEFLDEHTEYDFVGCKGEFLLIRLVMMVKYTGIAENQNQKIFCFLYHMYMLLCYFVKSR